MKRVLKRFGYSSDRNLRTISRIWLHLVMVSNSVLTNHVGKYERIECRIVGKVLFCVARQEVFMSEKQTEEQINRRKFLKVAAVTAVAATATGAGASLLNSQKSPTATITGQPSPPPSSKPIKRMI